MSAYQRILLKLSGEALAGPQSFGLDAERVKSLALEVAAIASKGIQVGVVIFAAGTSNPYFSTDTAATLRALEIKAQVVAKATKVNGVYDKDPNKFDDAVMFDRIGYTEVLTKSLGVMDATSIAMCRDNKLPIQVFNLNTPGNIMRMATGEPVGTIIG